MTLSHALNGPRVIVKHGTVRCPECGERLLGYADVTVHPTIKIEGEELVLGGVVDRIGEISQEARDNAPLTLTDELQCEGCAYHVNARQIAIWLLMDQKERVDA